jgi:hypothetical protein
VRYVAAIAAFGTAIVSVVPVYAQEAAAAQALFDEGKRLMDAGKYAEACPKLMESQRLDPGGGTLMAIALCHEAEGKTATAWADFNLALAEARKDHRSDRENAAAEHVKALEQKLTRLRIIPPMQKPHGLEIKRDGVLVGEPQWGTPLPIDPGEHAFEATAPGKTPWKESVDVRGEGRIVDVNVGTPEDAPKVDAPAPAPAPAPPAPAHETASETGTQKLLAYIVGGAGVVATGIGLGFGLSASSKWSQAERACPRNACTDPAMQKQGMDAGSLADVSTVLVTAGAVAVVTGVVLWLTAPSGQ